MVSIYGETVGYVEGGDTPGCSGPCGACVLTAFGTDPINAYYQDAEFVDCRLTCWPYAWSAVFDLPANGGGAGSATAQVEVGLSKEIPSLAGTFGTASYVSLNNRISGGATGGDIPVGTPYCAIGAITNDLPLDRTAYAVPGTVGVAGPYSVLVEAVAFLDGSTHRVSYRFNGTEVLITSDPFDLPSIGGYASVFYGLDFGFPDLGSVSAIEVSGCPTLIIADEVSTIHTNQDNPEGYVA